jgi:hypothetical protein
LEPVSEIDVARFPRGEVASACPEIQGAEMDKFVHEGNLKHYRKMLDEMTHEPQRRQILMMLAEEEGKDRKP